MVWLARSVELAAIGELCADLSKAQWRALALANLMQAFCQLNGLREHVGIAFAMFRPSLNVNSFAGRLAISARQDLFKARGQALHLIHQLESKNRIDEAVWIIGRKQFDPIIAQHRVANCPD
jgi:hypothetical protein